MLYRLGSWSARNRWPVLAAWLTAVTLSLLGLPQLISSMGAPSVAIDGAPSERAKEIVARDLPQFGDEQLLLVLRSERRTTDDPTYRDAVAAATGVLSRDPGIRTVVPMPRAGESAPAGPLAELAGVHSDPHNAYALVAAVGDDSTRQLNIPRQRAEVQAAVSTVDNDVRAYLLGQSTINYDLRRIELQDLARAELIAVPAALLILMLGFGALRAALVPLALAGASVVVTLGLFGRIAPVAGFDVVLLTIVSIFGVAVGTDYALLVVSRFREELAGGCSAEHAAATALATAGRTVLYSGLVVILASGSLFAVRSQVFREFAYGTTLVITVMLAAVCTLLPALLMFMSRHLRGRPAGRSPDQGRWARWAAHLMRHPWPYTLAAGAVLLCAAAPALGLRLGVDFGRQAIATTPSGHAVEIVERDGLAGAASAINVVVPRERDSAPPDTTALSRALRADPAVAAVVDIDNGSTLSMHVVVPRAAPDNPEVVELARHIRDDLVPGTGLGGHGVVLGGVGGLLLDISDETTGKLWWVIGFVVGLSLLMLAVMFRSVLLPIKAVLMNLLATAAAMGLTVVAFQHGFAEHAFGFTSLGAIQVHLPIVVFTILFGLSMDYEVFLVRRMQENYRRTGDNATAVAAGLQSTARLISVAAAIMVVVFASIIASRALELQQLGFALAAAVIVDATLIRLVLVPALMQLLGRWNWWMPGAMTRKSEGHHLKLTAHPRRSTLEPAGITSRTTKLESALEQTE